MVKTRPAIAALSVLALAWAGGCSSSSKPATKSSTPTTIAPPPTTPSTRPLNSAVAVPQVIGPVTGGNPDIPMNAMLASYKSQYGYRESEYFLQGTATVVQRAGRVR